MPVPVRHFLLPAALACAHLALAQSAAITMDGTFDDWTPGLTTFVDGNVPPSGIDLQRMQVTNDDRYLYIKLTVGTEIDLQSDLVPQTIRLYIDADNNAATGTSPQTGYGAELQVRFDTRNCTQYVPSSTTVSWSSIDLVSLPTTTSRTFEIAIARNSVPDGLHALFTSSTIRLLFRESDGGDAMPDAGTVFSYTFDPTPVPAYVPISVAKSDPTLVRITAYNVLSDGITNTSLQAPFQRILTAISPDIIGFSECVSSTAAQVKTRLDAWIPIGGAGWYVVKDDYDMVIASRWPILASWPSLTRQFAALIDLPATYATDLLFTAAHLHCCTADANRQAEADEYVQFVHDAMTPGGSITLPANTPMVYAGDLNSVGFEQELATLLTGDIQDNAQYGPDGPMDWDGTDIAAATALQTEARMAYTWRNNSSTFPSGLLDHFFYTDAAATLSKSFVLRTEIMPPATLSALGLTSGDVTAASDHMPVTGDLQVPPAGVQLNMRAFLQGPFDAGTGLMYDSLRVHGLIPLNEPYSALGFDRAGGGGEHVDASVLATTGTNAIVDWVLVELRDGTSPSTIVATRAALLQRDGDVVDLDGLSPVRLPVAAGSYHVALRHRNHLGIMTSAALPLSSAITTVDLTAPASALYGTNATTTAGGVRALWQGNVLLDHQLKYTGAGNDRDPILVRVGGTTPNSTLAGYFSEDTNLDGTVNYTGAGNDRDPILVNVGGSLPTSTRSEQLP